MVMNSRIYSRLILLRPTGAATHRTLEAATGSRCSRSASLGASHPTTGGGVAGGVLGFPHGVDWSGHRAHWPGVVGSIGSKLVVAFGLGPPGSVPHS